MAAVLDANRNQKNRGEHEEDLVECRARCARYGVVGQQLIAQESAKLQPQDYLDIRQLIDRYAHIQRAAGSGGSPARR